MEKQFEKSTFFGRLKSMLAVDFRRMFTMRFFYIMAGIALVMPVLILVMTTMMDGSVSVDPTTGKETVMEGFESVWLSIGTVAGGASDGAMAMDLVSMCNINLVFFVSCVLVCAFIADDFRSGYTKNLFAVRAKKTDYVFSKTLVCYVGAGLMLLAYFVGTLLGGAIAGLPFALEGFTVGNIFCCMIAKLFLMGVFVAVYALMAVIAKQRLWLSILLSLGVSMLLFTMVPMITPINATFINVVLCLVGGGVFAVGLGAIARLLLVKRDIL